MSSRFGWLITLFSAFSFVVACAEGAPASAPDVQLANADLAIPPAVCGDGMKDKNEMCDCPESATGMCAVPEEITCSSLGMGSGQVYCDATTCLFVTAMCSMVQGNTGGTGGGAGAGN